MDNIIEEVGVGVECIKSVCAVKMLTFEML